MLLRRGSLLLNKRLLSPVAQLMRKDEASLDGAAEEILTRGRARALRVEADRLAEEQLDAHRKQLHA